MGVRGSREDSGGGKTSALPSYAREEGASTHPGHDLPPSQQALGLKTTIPRGTACLTAVSRNQPRPQNISCHQTSEVCVFLWPGPRLVPRCSN